MRTTRSPQLGRLKVLVVVTSVVGGTYCLADYQRSAEAADQARVFYPPTVVQIRNFPDDEDRAGTGWADVAGEDEDDGAPVDAAYASQPGAADDSRAAAGR